MVEGAFQNFQLIETLKFLPYLLQRTRTIKFKHKAEYPKSFKPDKEIFTLVLKAVPFLTNVPFWVKKLQGQKLTHTRRLKKNAFIF